MEVAFETNYEKDARHIINNILL